MFLGLKKSVKIQNLQIGKEQVIKGIISSNKSINIPLLKSECIYYYLYIEKTGRGPMKKSRYMWMPEKVYEDICDFYLADDTGIIYIKTDNCKIRYYNYNLYTGYINEKKTKRYSLKMFNHGDLVKIRGKIIKNENKSSILVPDNKGVIEIYYLSNKK